MGKKRMLKIYLTFYIPWLVNFFDKSCRSEKTIKRKDFSTELYRYTFEEDRLEYEQNDSEPQAKRSLQEDVESKLNLETTNKDIAWINEMIRDSHLSEREKDILCNKYDIDLMVEPLDTLQLAKKYRMTTQSVNRICRSALEKLKKVSA